MKIQWNDFEPQGYEDMVSVLLSRLHPSAQRIDGKGGDGGRDVQIVEGQDGPIIHAFELKSFTGRMDPRRRRQVKRSLNRAASLGPEQWTLVVPIDPTPDEDKWFRKLGKDYSFPIKWYGKTWLDEKMSTFPDIRRYYLEGTSDEVVRLLLELQKEQAMITDVPDAMGRLRTLRERLNEIDPHYRYELSTGKDAADGRPTDVVFSVGFCDMRVDAYSKYLGATEDRPVTVTVKILVDSDDEVVQDALNYGLEATIPPHKVAGVTVDAPFGLGGDFTETKFILTPINNLDDPVTFLFDIMDGDKILASLPVHLTERTSGLRGSTLTGSDSTGWLQARIKVNVETMGLEAKFWLTPQSTIPEALLPLCRWVDACRPPHHLRFRWQGGLEPRTEIRESFLADDSLSRIVEALAYLQKRCGIHWEMSPSLTPEEGQQILAAAAMLKEETIDFTWNSWNLRLDHSKPALQELMDGSTHAFLCRQDVWIELEGMTVATVRTQIYLESARLANPGAVERALMSGSVPHLNLVPGESDKGQRAAALLPALQSTHDDESGWGVHTTRTGAGLPPHSTQALRRDGPSRARKAQEHV